MTIVTRSLLGTCANYMTYYACHQPASLRDCSHERSLLCRVQRLAGGDDSESRVEFVVQHLDLPSGLAEPGRGCEMILQFSLSHR